MHTRSLLFTILVVFSLPASADRSSSIELEQWVNTPQAIPPAVVPGAFFDAEAIATLGAVLPPGYIDAFNFPQASIEVQSSEDYRPLQPYREVSLQHAGTAVIKDDGSIDGYVAGLPFSTAQIDASQPRSAGYMVAWNNIFRWNYYGYRSKPVTMYYLSTTGNSVSGQRPEGIGGEAAIERSVEMWFHRIYLSRLAMLPDNNYNMEVSGAGDTHYKEFMEITAPFDVAGAKFIIERSLDPYQDDQVNSYLPTERRVRRLSTQERADSFMGSEYTFDDLEGFSGRVMDYEWELVGRKSILAVADSRHDRIHVYGPDSRVANDRWQLRDCYVVKMVPRWDGHPYGVKYVFIDRQTWLVHLALIFNRDGQHWKTIDPIWQYPELPHDPDSPTATVARWFGTIGVDLNKNNATVSQTLETTIPAMKASTVRRLFDVSALNEGR